MTAQECSSPCPLHSDAFQLWREEIRASIARLQEGQERLEHELLGNGQPGKVNEFDRRLRELEDHKSRSLGRGSVLLLFGTALVSLIVSVTAALVSGAFGARHSTAPHAIVELPEGR